MKKILVILILLAPLPIQAASLIINGSFEADGLIDLEDDPLTGWDVNIPGNFGGDIEDNWSSHDGNSLRIYSDLYGSYSAGDTAYIFQQVDLTDANELIFDMYLYELYGSWLGSDVTAFVSIDDSSNYIWTSDVEADGAYYDVNVPLGSYTGIHTLHFGMRVNVSGTLSASYRILWDFIKFDAYCGGFGYLASDLNRDCYVDFADFSIIAVNWFRDDLQPEDDYFDIDTDGIIDFLDLLVLADEWVMCSDWSNSDCVEVPLDLDADINMDGIVNFFDYAILTANWPVPMDEKADIDESGIVDYNDLKIMNTQWLQKSWLYISK